MPTKLGGNLQGPFFHATMDHPGARHARNVAGQARENPGEWIELIVGALRSTATSKVTWIRQKPSMAFRPAGAYEARSEKRDDGYAVLVRFVGWPERGHR